MVEDAFVEVGLGEGVFRLYRVQDEEEDRQLYLFLNPFQQFNGQRLVLGGEKLLHAALFMLRWLHI